MYSGNNFYNGFQQTIASPMPSVSSEAQMTPTENKSTDKVVPDGDEAKPKTPPAE